MWTPIARISLIIVKINQGLQTLEVIPGNPVIPEILFKTKNRVMPAGIFPAD